MTQRQRKAKAKRAGARRRKVNAAVVAWKRMNPGKKLPEALRIKPLTGGGFSVTPLKVNPVGFRETYKMQREGGTPRGLALKRAIRQKFGRTRGRN